MDKRFNIKSQNLCPIEKHQGITIMTNKVGGHWKKAFESSLLKK